MSAAIDLDRYFERIGYEGTKSPTLETLKILHKKHTQNIPFENLDPLLGMEVKLNTDSLQQKMIHHNRGGYCYEQNLLFLHVLKTIGFKAKGLAARIRWNKADDEITPRSHMLLEIEIGNGHFLADAGFGNNTLTGPVLLEPDVVQQTPHEPRRLIRDKDEFIMQTLISNQWKDLYQFDLREYFVPDYEITNWYLSNHPRSHFVNDLIAARPERGRRYTLRNNQFSIHHLGGETVKKEIKPVDKLRDILVSIFNLTLPDKEEIDHTFSKLIESDR